MYIIIIAAIIKLISTSHGQDPAELLQFIAIICAVAIHSIISHQPRVSSSAAPVSGHNAPVSSSSRGK
jgi:hypothetical protein